MDTSTYGNLLTNARTVAGPNESKVFIFRDGEALARFGGELILVRSAKKPIAVGLSGGQTPEKMFAWLAHQKIAATTDFFFVDERFVPIDARDSNYKKAKDLFFEPAHIAETRVHRYMTEHSAEDAARLYEDELKKYFEIEGSAEIPAFDLLFLGMGDDGHTASLFSGSSSIHEDKHLAIVSKNPHNQQTRLTLTLPVLNHAQESIVMVQGTKKAAMIQRVFKNLNTLIDPNLLPIEYVRPTVWALDEEAAALIGK